MLVNHGIVSSWCAGINRYTNECDRLYQVLDDSLKGKEWLANNEYSIADMAAFPWVYSHLWAGEPPY